MNRLSISREKVSINFIRHRVWTLLKDRNLELNVCHRLWLLNLDDDKQNHWNVSFSWASSIGTCDIILSLSKAVKNNPTMISFARMLIRRGSLITTSWKNFFIFTQMTFQWRAEFMAKVVIGVRSRKHGKVIKSNRTFFSLFPFNYGNS